MDYVLDKYVSPRVFMTLGFSLSRRQREHGGQGKRFWRVLAWVFRLVELIKQSKRRNCEDVCASAMMCIGKMAGRVVLPRFSRLTDKCRYGLC